MKKIITLSAVVLISMSSMAQTKTPGAKFLNRFQALIERMTDSAAECSDSVHAWQLERKTLKYEYKDKYKKVMTEEEGRRYSTLVTQYKKRYAELKLNKFGESLGNFGQKVGNKVSGVVDGLKE